MAINIFIGILVVLFFWWVVRLLNMSLLSTIMGSILGGGAIVIVIVFQQEIRRFLLLIGNHEFFKQKNILHKYFNASFVSTSNQSLKQICNACRHMSKTKTGALIVISDHSELVSYVQTGDVLNADISHRLLESIFVKNSPMHDGAVIIVSDKVKAARCVLPINDDLVLPAEYGLRHRAALSMSMETDSVVIVVSEETGNISYAKGTHLSTNVSHETLFTFLINVFMVKA